VNHAEDRRRGRGFRGILDRSQRPRLYETFGNHLRVPLAPVVTPLRIELWIGRVETLQGASGEITTTTGERREYDRLVLAPGSSQQPLPVPGAGEHAFDVDTFVAAARLDAHLASLVRKVPEPDLLCFAVIGAGFIGIEMACELRRRIRVHSNDAIAASARVLLIEREAVTGPQLGDNPRPFTDAALRDSAVEVLVNTRVTRITAAGLELEGGTWIPSRTVIVASGLRANALAQTIDVPKDEFGRIRVDRSLRVTAHPGWFAAGDIASASTDGKHLALMSCQHAMEMGRFAGANVARDLCSLPLLEYRQTGYQTCLDLGDQGALLTHGWQREVVKTGNEAKAIKALINHKLIVPPSNDPEALLAAAAPRT
jgi:NADH dehydrogenase